jgi:hypothetical protein
MVVIEWIGSTGNVFGVHKYSLIMQRVRIFGDGSQLYVILFPRNLWVNQQVELMVGELMVPVIGGAVQLLPPVASTVHAGVDDIVFDWRGARSGKGYLTTGGGARIEGDSGDCSLSCC